MAIAKKVTKTNHLPSEDDGRFVVYSKQFNELVDVVNELEPADGTLVANTISESTSGSGVTVDGVLLKDSQVTTDVINEKTAATGVTIDGALLKDGALTPANGVVTQITSITTGVTLNQPSGVITTVTATTVALSSSTFRVTNSFATATSNIQVYIVDYSGTIVTNGVPIAVLSKRYAGSFDVVLYNAHATNALNGVVQLAFVIFK